MIRRHAARLLCVAGIALGVAAPGRAHAEDDATVEMARQRFREGVQFYDQRQYEKARLAFLQAYALKPHPSVLLNLAQSELRSGHPDDSANHFAEYLKGNPDTSDTEREETEVGFAAAKSKVGEITVSVDVSGAVVSIDGAEKGTAPLPGPIYVTPGSHTLEAHSGDKHATKTINANAGQTMNASLSLRTASAAPPPPPPKAENEEDGDREPPPEAKPQDEEPADSPSTAPEPEPTGGRKPFFKWMSQTPAAMVGAGLTVLGTGGAITFALLAGHSYANANDLRSQILGAWTDKTLKGNNGQSDQQWVTLPQNSNPAAAPDAGPCTIPDKAAQTVLPGGLPRAAQYADACKRWNNNSSSGDQYKTLAIVSGAVGGAALVGTVVYYFMDSNAENKSSASNHGFQARVLPYAGPGASGLTVIGQF